jgi:hypothetical protein
LNLLGWVWGGSLLLAIMAVWNASNFLKNAPNSHDYLQQAVTPDPACSNLKMGAKLYILYFTKQNSLQGRPKKQ